MWVYKGFEVNKFMKKIYLWNFLFGGLKNTNFVVFFGVIRSTGIEILILLWLGFYLLDLLFFICEKALLANHILSFCKYFPFYSFDWWEKVQQIFFKSWDSKIINQKGFFLFSGFFYFPPYFLFSGILDNGFQDSWGCQHEFKGEWHRKC